MARSVRVEAPDGRAWVVSRRWTSRPRWRRGNLDLADLGSLGEIGSSDSSAGIVAAIVLFLVLTIALAIVIVVLLPLVLFVGELALVVAGAYLLGRPWVVSAVTDGPPAEVREWPVQGFRRSRRAVEEVARELEAGAEASPEGAGK